LQEERQQQEEAHRKEEQRNREETRLMEEQRKKEEEFKLKYPSFNIYMSLTDCNDVKNKMYMCNFALKIF
jgi:hypothetical protein